MKKILFNFAVAIMVAAGLMTGAVAEDAPCPPGVQIDGGSRSTPAADSGISGYQTFLAGDIIGSTIINSQGEDLGRITDLVYDSRGRIAFAVLRTSAHLQMGGKHVAVPFSALSQLAGTHRLLLDIEQDQLQTARSFEPNILNDERLASEMYRHFGQQPYWENGEQRNIIQETPRPGNIPDIRTDPE
jgi:sporulation protein YlmC with PRC-barrel domain